MHPIGNTESDATVLFETSSLGYLVAVPQSLKNGGFLSRVKIPTQTGGNLGLYVSPAKVANFFSIFIYAFMHRF